MTAPRALQRPVPANDAAPAADAAAELNLRASARKPTRGSLEKIFSTPAVSVVTSSHAVGASVTHT